MGHAAPDAAFREDLFAGGAHLVDDPTEVAYPEFGMEEDGAQRHDGILASGPVKHRPGKDHGPAPIQSPVDLDVDFVPEPVASTRRCGAGVLTASHVRMGVHAEAEAQDVQLGYA